LSNNHTRGENDRHKNWHHIFSSSRYPRLSSVGWNKIKVNSRRHILYHYLFNNASPMEITKKIREFFPKYLAVTIVYFLNHEYWGEIFIINIKKKNIKLILKEKYRREFKNKVENSNEILQ